MVTDIDEIIQDIESKARGRTRYEGQEPYRDEVLVAEIKRLRELCDKAAVSLDGRPHVHSPGIKGLTNCDHCELVEKLRQAAGQAGTCPTCHGKGVDPKADFRSWADDCPTCKGTGQDERESQ